MAETLFTLRDIGFAYEAEDKIFTNFNLRIEKGEKICLLGANGSGKSTLLKILCALIFPQKGHFVAFDREITEAGMEDEAFARNYHRRVGFIFQNSEVQLFTTRVRDEIAFGPLQLGLDGSEVKRRVSDMLSLLNIEHLQNKSPHRLSGGEKKKVAVASVLVLNPQVLILDEPTNGLDPRTQSWLVNLLLELNHRGCTIITSTHNLDLAHALSTRALVLAEDHKLVYDGPSVQALNDMELLQRVNLIGEYCHVHGQNKHIHHYTHG